MFDREPKMGDIVVYNPPRRKGLKYGFVIGFTRVGLPILKENLEDENCLEYAPKTGFAVVQ